MVKTPCCDETGLKKGTWTQEEDCKLIAYVTRYGCWNWRRLPKFAGLSRCGKSCRLRWLNYLRPNIKRGNFSKEEENVIIRLHEAHGNKWSMIAAKLDGRTDNEVKNHWHTNLKKSFKNMKSHEGKKNTKDTEKRGPKPAANDSVISTTSDQILESFPRSPPPPPPQPSSSSESSNMMTTNWQVGYDHNETNSPPVTTAYADISGDSVINTTSDQILESFPRSPPPPPPPPQPSSSSESSNIITRNWQDGYDHNETNSPPVTAYADISGDFWTDPFVVDNFYVGQDYNAVSLIDPEFSFSQCPVSSEELLGQFGFYDEQDCLIWLN